MPALRNWQSFGFRQAPQLAHAGSNGVPDTLYRVWGNTSAECGNPNSPGVIFTFDQAVTRKQAEILFAVGEYGNGLIWVTEFRVASGTPLWIGQVDPGHGGALLGPPPGSQVFIERLHMLQVRRGPRRRLVDDLGFPVLRLRNTDHLGPRKGH